MGGEVVINPNNGDININGSSLIIQKGLSKNDFVSSRLFKDVLIQEIHAFSNYYLKPQLIGKDKFMVVLFFNQKDMIYLVNMSLSDDGNVLSWNNWSEDEAIKIKERHDQWLEDSIGKPPYKYSWGEISSNYDPRSGSSMITIRYNIQQTT